MGSPFLWRDHMITRNVSSSNWRRRRDRGIMTTWCHLMFSKSGLNKQVHSGGLKSPVGNLASRREIHLPGTLGPGSFEGVAARRGHVHNHRPGFPLLVVFAGQARIVSGQREEWCY